MLDPVAWALVLMLTGMVAGHWRQDAQTAFTGIAVALLLLVTILPVGIWLARSLENTYPRPSKLPPHIEGILVLDGGMGGGVEMARGAPTPNNSMPRILAAVDLARRYPSARLIYSGCIDQREQGRARMRAAVRQLVAAMGLAPARVTFEDRSTNSEQSMVNLRKMLHPMPGQTWMLVTSAVHLPRSMQLAQDIGWQLTPWPSDYVSPPGPVGVGRFNYASGGLPEIDYALHEWVGLAAHRLGIH